jgi:phosphonoacetaldehyde hydrolase
MNAQPANPLKAVIFDWAGTMVDFGSIAPMGAFVKLFERHGIEITVAEARIPMGLPKWNHIHALAALPRIAAQWQRIHGRPFDDTHIDALYEEFTPMNAESVKDCAALVPGALDVVRAFRARDLKIGSTTGYNRPIMNVLAPLAAKQGYVPDNLVCAGDLAAGRPTPLMMYRCFADLGVWPAEAVVKVDDTAPGIAEGLVAGCWTIGVTISGNAAGLTLADWQALDAAARTAVRDRASAELRSAGAHELVDTVADLLPALDRIWSRIAQGEQPLIDRRRKPVTTLESNT